jgi:GMP synthase (glutamine-hydrolysing)
MKIHCIWHETYEGLAFIEEWIKKNNHHLTSTYVFLEQHYPSEFDFEMLIILSGSASVYETEKYS